MKSAIFLAVLLLSVCFSSAGPLSYAICQTGCNFLAVACYGAGGAVMGTVTAGVGVPAAIIACNVGLGVPQLSVTGASNSKAQDQFTFNEVFTPEESQERVYLNSVKPIIGKLFEGYNLTIIAYGQTGTGKTYTMGTNFDGVWDSKDTGIIPRALRDIFAEIDAFEDHTTCEVTCSFIELYQEKLYDLLSGRDKENSICDIREDSSKGIFITGLSELPVDNAQSAAIYLIDGGNTRTTASTAMNDASSRSHAIFTLNLKIESVNDEGQKTSTKSKFHLVDLAGSERSKKTKSTGTRFKEGVKINEGLLALGNVISALGGGSGANGGFISYRDSKLTRLLQDSLGGNSVTLMFCCVSPADYNIEETISTLRYADRAKKIKNKPMKNQDSHEVELQSLKQTIAELRKKLMQPDGDNTKRRTSGLMCGDFCNRAKLDLIAENNELREKLSDDKKTARNLHVRNFIEDLCSATYSDRYRRLRDLVLDNIKIDMPGYQEIIDETKTHNQILDECINKAKSSIPEDFFQLSYNEERDDPSNEFESLQLESAKKIDELEREMKLKQEMIDFQSSGAPYDEAKNKSLFYEYQKKIESLEDELEELRSFAKQRKSNIASIDMERKSQVEMLEKELAETRKKCENLQKAMIQAGIDRKRIEQLKKEIVNLKAGKVDLIRKKNAESDQHKKRLAEREREINKMQANQQKTQTEKDRMTRLFEHQKAVLNRKFEEAKALNRRLQEALRQSKQNPSNHGFSKVPPGTVQSCIDNELSELMTMVDSKVAMQSLINDRGLVAERLMNLKALVIKSESINDEILELQEELEMRHLQIADLRHKVVDTDVDSKVKNMTEKFVSITQLRIAVNHLVHELLDCREDLATAEIISDELMTANEHCELQIIQMNGEIVERRQLLTKAASMPESNDYSLKLEESSSETHEPVEIEEISDNPTDNPRLDETFTFPDSTVTIYEAVGASPKGLRLNESTSSSITTSRDGSRPLFRQHTRKRTSSGMLKSLYQSALDNRKLGKDHWELDNISECKREKYDMQQITKPYQYKKKSFFES